MSSKQTHPIYQHLSLSLICVFNSFFLCIKSFPWHTLVHFQVHTDEDMHSCKRRRSDKMRQPHQTVKKNKKFKRKLLKMSPPLSQNMLPEHAVMCPESLRCVKIKSWFCMCVSGCGGSVLLGASHSSPVGQCQVENNHRVLWYYYSWSKWLQIKGAEDTFTNLKTVIRSKFQGTDLSRPQLICCS